MLGKGNLACLVFFRLRQSDRSSSRCLSLLLRKSPRPSLREAPRSKAPHRHRNNMPSTLRIHCLALRTATEERPWPSARLCFSSQRQLPWASARTIQCRPLVEPRRRANSPLPESSRPSTVCTRRANGPPLFALAAIALHCRPLTAHRPGSLLTAFSSAAKKSSQYVASHDRNQLVGLRHCSTAVAR